MGGGGCLEHPHLTAPLPLGSALAAVHTALCNQQMPSMFSLLQPHSQWEIQFKKLGRGAAGRVKAWELSERLHALWMCG